MSRLVSVVLVAVTPAGPVDIDSVDGTELTLIAPDDDLLIANGVGSLFGGHHHHSFPELTEPPTPGTTYRLEVRLLTETGDPA